MIYRLNKHNDLVLKAETGADEFIIAGLLNVAVCGGVIRTRSRKGRRLKYTTPGSKVRTTRISEYLDCFKD